MFDTDGENVRKYMDGRSEDSGLVNPYSEGGSGDDDDDDEDEGYSEEERQELEEKYPDYPDPNTWRDGDTYTGPPRESNNMKELFQSAESVGDIFLVVLFDPFILFSLGSLIWG